MCIKIRKCVGFSVFLSTMGIIITINLLKMNYKSVLITCIAIISCIGSVSAFSDFDKNHDGTVDEYESCMFEYSKGEYYCKAFTEDAQKAMWERYGNMGAIPSKAF